jgi:hypothetical protein
LVKLNPPRVKQRITDVGYYYQVDGQPEFGLFSVNDEQDPDFDANLAAKLGVDPKELFATRTWEIQRPTTFDELANALGCTIRQDVANKLILLCAGVLTLTKEDQVNILMSGESAGGKSYTALEVASYFPSETLRVIATASLTAFFHDQGTWDRERRILVVDLKQKLIIFLDQPHYTLMERVKSSREITEADRIQAALYWSPQYDEVVVSNGQTDVLLTVDYIQEVRAAARMVTELLDTQPGLAASRFTPHASARRFCSNRACMIHHAQAGHCSS